VDGSERGGTDWKRRLCAALIAAVIAVGAASCGTSDAPKSGHAPITAPVVIREPATRSHSTTVRLIFGGDVMLGRGVAGLAQADPAEVFAGIKFELTSADLAVANLESPLTARPHDPARGPNALEARPRSAQLLAAAGFAALGIANNHAGDAGPQTVTDTMRALAGAGLLTIGAGKTVARAYTPRIVRRNDVRIAFLSFDATSEGPRAGPARPGVAWWNDGRVRAAVTRARSEADVVVVGLHGGSDYDPTTDPRLLQLGRLLAAWGADVVWGSGPHVVQPTEVIAGRDGRSAILATSLGNLVFDQHIPGTRQGELLEVLAGRSGVRAFRLGTTQQQPSNAVSFGSWLPPRGDAAALGQDWWTLATTVRPTPIRQPAGLRGFAGKVVAAAIGDPEGNGARQLVVSFWRPYRQTDVNALIPRSELVDRRGLTAHIGLYRPSDRHQLWVAGTLLRPVRRLAACDGSLAVAYSTLDGTTVVGVGAWRWNGFGFSPLPDLAGRGIPACVDVDGDGRLDPVILARSSR
jgi:poly-gamma-glutamate capsule biosynthesis protein CapA/YwtB (metallophosphatase superfamily)